MFEVGRNIITLVLLKLFNLFKYYAVSKIIDL